MVLGGEVARNAVDQSDASHTWRPCEYPQRVSETDGFEQVPSHLWRYAQDQGFLSEAAAETKRFLEELALDASIDVHLVESRAKTLASYTDKSQKKKEDGTAKYTDPATQIHDCVAARVIVYTLRARNDLADLIVARCDWRERQNPGQVKHNGYDSEHIVISGIKDPEVKRILTRRRPCDLVRGRNVTGSIAGQMFLAETRGDEREWQRLAAASPRGEDDWDAGRCRISTI